MRTMKASEAAATSEIEGIRKTYTTPTHAVSTANENGLPEGKPL